MNFSRALWHVVPAAVLTALAACSGAATTTPTQNIGGFTGLAADKRSTCVPASTSAQTVQVGPAGGVVATLGIGAFPANGGCFNVVLSTGDNVEATSLRRAAAETRNPLATTPKPLLTLSVGEAFGSGGGFLGSVIVTNMQFSVSPALNFPDGTYYALVEQPSLLGLNVFPIVAKNGVLTVGAANYNNGGPVLPIAIHTSESALIAIYPLGVFPPAPTAAPTATPSPSASPSSAPSASPSPTPTAQPTTAPSAPPAGAPVVLGISLTPGGCYHFGFDPAQEQFSAFASIGNAPPNLQWWYAYFAGGSNGFATSVSHLDFTYGGYGATKDSTFNATSAGFADPSKGQSGQTGGTGGANVRIVYNDQQLGTTFMLDTSGKIAQATTSLTGGTINCP